MFVIAVNGGDSGSVAEYLMGYGLVTSCLWTLVSQSVEYRNEMKWSPKPTLKTLSSIILRYFWTLVYKQDLIPWNKLKICLNQWHGNRYFKKIFPQRSIIVKLVSLTHFSVSAGTRSRANAISWRKRCQCSQYCQGSGRKDRSSRPNWTTTEIIPLKTNKQTNLVLRIVSKRKEIHSLSLRKMRKRRQGARGKLRANSLSVPSPGGKISWMWGADRCTYIWIFKKPKIKGCFSGHACKGQSLFECTISL